MSNAIVEQPTEKGTQTEVIISPEEAQKEIFLQVNRFIESVHPAYLVKTEQMKEMLYDEPDIYLDKISFYRLTECLVEDVDNKAEELYKYLNEKMNRFFAAIHSIGETIVYGVVSYQGKTNLVIGINQKQKNNENARKIMEGLLNEVKIEEYKPVFSNRKKTKKHVGLISAIPTVKIGNEKQKINIATLLRSLNGQNYTVLFVMRPVNASVVLNKYNELVDIKDKCFAVSKRNVSQQKGSADGDSVTDGDAITDGTSKSKTLTGTMNRNAGLNVIFVNASKGYSIGNSFTTQKSHSETKNHSETKSHTENYTVGISADIQNGIALEAMVYADKAIERLKQGMNNGIWETVISYSAEDEMAAGIIKASLSGEIGKPVSDIGPQWSYSGSLPEDIDKKNSLLLPKVLENEPMSSLCTMLTSEEVGLLCTLPAEAVPDFEIRNFKRYPLVSSECNQVFVGNLHDGIRELDNMPYGLSDNDLVRHTFVCGITGSGKTTTVKNILRNANCPFLVIESAKKEYRNMKFKDGSEEKKLLVYTLGKPEINCLRCNPFYIPYGINPQMHIDFLKDLFNASFSFYGPMPYILETCLQNIYRKKGWNLTMGFHPYLVGKDSPETMFEAKYIGECYKMKAHKYLFPTMQDLKNEIERYIEEDMQYDGEVAGNIKTAMKTRLEGLCSGTKGYMFNTYEYADMCKLLQEKVVFELEGLSDDSDKAFCLGLLLIYINEYRQVTKEISKDQKVLQHLLVIEEAHRLLKNVDTERSSENMGNPKGKAVEHFTNMIAEMRSYGQGVIVAEQIPTKLAPDVIKNSSNKIIQKLVAADDQNLVASTIGLSTEDAVHIGTLKTGMALCHKEGMSLPVRVQIPHEKESSVSDASLYADNIELRLEYINRNMIKECMAKELDLCSLGMLNAILLQDYKMFTKSLELCRKKINSILKRKNVGLVFCHKPERIYAELLGATVIQYIQNGVYSVGHLIENALHDTLIKLFAEGKEEDFSCVKELLKEAFGGEDIAYQGIKIISNLVYNQMNEYTDIQNTVRNYFMIPEDRIVKEICNLVEGM